VLVALSANADATVIVRPHFGHPFIFPDRIIFTSVDGAHVIAIDKAGKLRWEAAFSQRVLLQRESATAVLAQCARDVFRLDVSGGQRAKIITMPEHEVINVDPDIQLALSRDTRPENNLTRILDRDDFHALWSSSSIEEIVHASDSTVVAVTATRHIESGSSFRLSGAKLCGFERLTGTLRWSFELSDGQAMQVRAAPVGKFLAILDGLFSPQLLVLNPESGEVLSRRKGNFVDLGEWEGKLAVMEVEESNSGNGHLYLCGLPACDLTHPVLLKAREILRFRFYQDFLITAGIYDAACFSRLTGERLWDKGQLEWSQPYDDLMVVTDFSTKDRRSRIVAVALRTGTERVLFSRRVTRTDEREFQPW